MRSMVGGPAVPGLSLSGQEAVPGAPSTTLRAVPLPRFTGEERPSGSNCLPDDYSLERVFGT